jgi:ABC-type amino acid transport substrate-binding protein
VDAVQFFRHTEESGISALQTGQIDLLAAHLPHTLRGDDEIDFSQTIYQDGIGLLVSSASGIEAFAALNGASVAVPRDGATAELFQQAAARQGLAVSVQIVESVDGALAGVAEGRYRAYADLRSELLILAYANPGFLVLDERLTERPVALGLRQNDALFRDLVNLTLQELGVNGSFASVYSGWFGTDRPYALDIWPSAPYRSLRLSPRPVAAP